MPVCGCVCVGACVCMCMCVCMCVCVCVCVLVFVREGACVGGFLGVYIYVCARACDRERVS